MGRLIFFAIYLALGAYLVFGAFRFAESYRAAAENAALSHRARLEVETRLRERQRTLLFVGDIMLSRGVGRMIAREADPRYPFLRIAEMTRKADFAFGNLEGVISDRGAPQGGGYLFRAEPATADGLSYAGFDGLSVANNHSMDYGREAYDDTLARLTARGIAPITKEPYVTTIGDAAVPLVAYAPVLPSFDQAAAITTITTLRTSSTLPQVDLIAVSLHWGEEYAQAPSKSQRELAHTLIDAGADLIIGHHSHVVQEIERYEAKPFITPSSSVIPAKAGIQKQTLDYPVKPDKDNFLGDATRVGYIAYSLGNFVFDQNFSEETMQGLMLEAQIIDGRLTNVEAVPISISATFQPALALEE